MAYLIAHFPDHYRAYIAGAALQRQLAGPIRLSYIQPDVASPTWVTDAASDTANRSTFDQQPILNQTECNETREWEPTSATSATNQLRAAGIEGREADLLAGRLHEHGGSLMLVQLSHRARAKPLLLQMGALEVMQYG